MDITDLMAKRGMGPGMGSGDDVPESASEDTGDEEQKPELMALDQIRDLLDQIEAKLMGAPGEEPDVAAPDMKGAGA